ncbi:spherulin-2A-like [Contarinia nasturtii]|uniref:spherulin-2A-like n=1 Tax=Contarinia nasturtii TaxID=265458 RepID=UPI0012D3956D|nr:spherulin-2A-like [Contarinia nasturtii]
MEIEMNIGKTIAKSYVSGSGKQCNIITDVERRTFGLGDDQIKDALAGIKGKRPCDVFVRSPTPWNDLYARYGWDQVQRITTISDAKVLDISVVPVLVNESILENNSSYRGDFGTDLSTTLRNSVSSNWNKSHGISVEQKITYGISFMVKGEGQTSFSYSHNWGHGGSESKTCSLGTSGNVKVSLGPGEKVIAQLVASRGRAKVEVDYHSYLTGGVALNYSRGHHGHHFWWEPIDSIMEQLDRENFHTSREIINIEMYSNLRVNLKK